MSKEEKIEETGDTPEDTSKDGVDVFKENVMSENLKLKEVIEDQKLKIEDLTVDLEKHVSFFETQNKTKLVADVLSFSNYPASYLWSLEPEALQKMLKDNEYAKRMIFRSTAPKGEGDTAMDRLHNKFAESQKRRRDKRVNR